MKKWAGYVKDDLKECDLTDELTQDKSLEIICEELLTGAYP